jgi:hypothetical protein
MPALMPADIFQKSHAVRMLAYVAWGARRRVGLAGDNANAGGFRCAPPSGVVLPKALPAVCRVSGDAVRVAEEEASVFFACIPLCSPLANCGATRVETRPVKTSVHVKMSWA